MSGGPLDEGRLARAAAAGDGQAFARLYDAYEQRIYTFCFRLVGNEQDAQDATQDAFLKVLQRLPALQDRELNFGAYLFTAARNASYDVIGRRKKADAVDEIPESGARPVYGDGAPLDVDPERAAMLGALQESVRGANERLPERQREVLALRELEELSYDEIAAIMDMNRNSVAQLISRARIKLRDELRGSALASVAASSADCERALPLIAMRQDGQLGDGEDRDWLAGHVAACATCQVSVEAMEEAGVSYRAWTPIVPAAFLFRDTMAKAAELTGSDWSAIGRPGADGGAGAAGTGTGAAAGAGGVLAGVGAAVDAAADVADDERRRRRGLFAGLLAAALLIVTGTVAFVAGTDDEPQRLVTETPASAIGTPTPGPTGAAATPASTTTATTPTRRTADRKSRPRTRAVPVVVAPGVTQTIQIPVAPTAAPTTPVATRRPGTRRPSRPGRGTVDTSGGGGGSGGQSGGRDPLKGTPAAPAPTAEPQAPAPQPDPAPAATPAPTAEPTPAPTAQPDPTPTPAPCRPTATACAPTTTGCQPTGAGCSRSLAPAPARAPTAPTRRPS
ncbi:sigma-70 family RNA polymerase sigma factor [Conexibacter sp. W3-3-2]|uniref:RNA polymerase sigma factor n=1 Tax=Conexibacter sp. W3-3-2 TaxID=2675227 RepID=UPI0012B978FC|nr:sigma-70 family RNA polymerase sigma factor [Conexibacter sp. W3-3-2]MTD43562.1 sigma-70 family RNA polymerase sigma factor [Conexibacter sp. W3-3-2]